MAASSSSPRVWLLAMALALVACVLLATSADAEASPAPPYGCNPLTDKTCKPEGQGIGVVLPSGGIDIDGDGDEDELPAFNSHFQILGHAN